MKRSVAERASDIGVEVDFGRWDLIRDDMESNTLTEAGICEKYGVSRDDLWARAREGGWRIEHREGGLDRLILIRQLFGVLERHVRKLEQVEVTEVGVKETTVLAKMVSSLDKLIQVEDEASRRSGPEETREMQEIRNKLARRIDNLKRQQR